MDATNSQYASGQQHWRTYSWDSRTIQDIEEQNKELPAAAKVEKYCKMAGSRYSLYRGTNHLFWRDFAWDWRMNRFGSYKTRTWLNGDCHVNNFGAFHAHTVGVVYGMNDFDDSIVADYQYDLWRLAVSLVLIASQNEIKRQSQEKVIQGLSTAYLDTLRRFRKHADAAEFCYTSANTYGQLSKFLAKLEKKERRQRMIEKWTTDSGGKHRFDLALGKLGPLCEAMREKVTTAVPDYIETLAADRNFGEKFFNVEDVAVRLGAGIGSLGAKRYYILLAGNDQSHPRDDIILDVKLQTRPSAYACATEDMRKEYATKFQHEAHRHTLAIRALRCHPDDLAGWMEFDGRYYSVLERSPYKESFPTEKLTTKKRFLEMAQQLGMMLATAHSRAAKFFPFDFAAEVSRLTDGRAKQFGALVCDVAFAYADQVESDYQAFTKCLAPGICPKG